MSWNLKACAMLCRMAQSLISIASFSNLIRIGDFRIRNLSSIGKEKIN